MGQLQLLVFHPPRALKLNGGYMTGSRPLFHRERGFTLVEVLIVVAIVLVMATIAVPQFNTAIRNYRINTTARQVQALATLAHVKAAARNTRYRVIVNTGVTPNIYRLQVCNDAVATRTNPCLAWGPDASSAPNLLPPGVAFAIAATTTTAAPVAISASTTNPAGCAPPAPCQTANMTFNSRGLLFSETFNAPADYRCFYLAGRGARPMAVCSVLTGRTIVYVLDSGAWTQL